MSAERVYRVKADSPETVEAQIKGRVAEMLQQLATDNAVRQAVRKNHPGIVEQFDDLRNQIQVAGEGELPIDSLISVQSQGAGIEPGTVLILITIAPPVIEHFAAPIAVHVCTSLWDSFILPELKRWAKKIEPAS